MPETRWDASHAVPGVSCHSLIKYFCQLCMEPMEGKRHTTIEAIQRTFSYKITEKLR